MSEVVCSFSTALPLLVFVRPTGEEDAEWQNFDQGPGYFHIPARMDVRVEIKNIDDRILTQLIEDIKDCPAVTYLDLSENRNVTNASLPRLAAGLPKLSGLSLSACDINDEGIVHLQGLSRLRTLNLSYCPRLTDGGVRELKNMRSLEYLDLQGCVKVTRGGVAYIERRNLTIHKPSRGHKMRPGDR